MLLGAGITQQRSKACPARSWAEAAWSWVHPTLQQGVPGSELGGGCLKLGCPSEEVDIPCSELDEGYSLLGSPSIAAGRAQA